MYRFFLVVAVAAASGSAVLANTATPMDAVRQYVAAFNKGDVRTMASTCTSPALIIDGLPPHAWQGPTACKDWYRDVTVAGKHEGAAGYFVTLGKPRHVDITGDRAYVVVPATMAFTVHGKAVRQSGSMFTVALRRVDEGWRITGWAWAKGGRE